MIKAITGGYINIHPSTFRMSRPKGLPHFILLVVRSHGSFDIGSEHFSVEPPQIIILAPHTPNYYGNPDGDYIDDWLHFDTDEPKLIERLNAISNHPFSVEDTNIFSFCIRHILLELSFGQPDFKDENMRALFTFLLNSLSTAHATFQSHANITSLENQLKQLHLEISNSLEQKHSIARCAKQLNISESYFQLIYKRLFGVSFQQDLILMRVTRARFILSTSNLSLSQIAEFCGYNNEVHFYRQFKKLTGVTPAQYRKHPF